MSERRKKDRYNETWTKAELTDSLKRTDKKSSHRRDSGRHRDKRSDDYYEEKERQRREEKEQSRHKSRSKRHGSSERNYDSADRERKTDRRSRKEEENMHRSDTRSRVHAKDDRRMNGDDRHHSKRDRHREGSRHHDESNHRTDKRSSRDSKHRDDAEVRRKDRRYEDDYDRKRNRNREDEYQDKREKRRDDDNDSRMNSRKEHRERDDGRRDKADYDEEDRRRRRRDDDHKERRRHKEERYEGQSKGGDHRRRRDDDRYERDEERRERKRIEKEEQKNFKDHELERDARPEKHRKNGHRNDDKRSRKYREDDIEPKSRHARNYGEDDNESRSEDSRYDRHREGTHRGKSHHDKLSGGSSSSSKSKSTEKKITDEKEENEYNYDDEEFEDYADDFEDDDDKSEEQASPPVAVRGEMDELMRAIAAENERANSAHSSGRFQNTVSDRNESPFSVQSSNSDRGNANEGHMTMINFSVAKKSSTNSRVKKRMVKRSNDLLNLIQLDSVAFDILEMPPVTEYNLYIKNYGNSNTKQASVQCNDDNMDQDVQTEIPDSEDKWSQHPPHDIKCCGGEKVSMEDAGNNDRERLIATMRGSSMHLTKFMSRASRLIECILNNDEMWESSVKVDKEKSGLSFCDGFVPLQTNLAYLQGRKAVHIASCQGSSQNLIAVAFEPASTSFSTRIDRKGLVAIWDSRKPVIPEKVLVCDACPTCCSFGPNKAYILFVGSDDGCILTYDLREPGVHHQIVSLDKTRETVLRNPTYTTGYLTDSHSSPIVSILPVNVDSKQSMETKVFPQDSDRQNQSGLAFQLASLEEIAKLSIWIVVEILSEAQSDEDLGLAPYGKIKLIRSINIDVKAPIKSKFPELPFRTTCFQFSILDPNNFYVGTDTGHIVHCTQYEGVSRDSSQPRNMNAGFLFFNEIEAVSTVASIDINPFQLFGASLILAGYEDGFLRLYLSDRELPVVSWPLSTNGAAVVKVQWSLSRPSVFFVLDSSHNLHVWDLAIMHAGPIKTEASKTKSICLFALSNASKSRSPEITLAYEESTSNTKSMVEAHKLAPHFAQLTNEDELGQLTLLLQSLL